MKTPTPSHAGGATSRSAAERPPAQRKAAAPNRTGLPDHLKSGIESLSGLSLDHVRVHRNSPQPAQLNAHAFAQGSDIHLAPRQEKHLPHEAWHVVQQAQGRVRPTTQLQRVAINDDPALECEADTMAAKAAGVSPAGPPSPAGAAAIPRAVRQRRPSAPGVVQRNAILTHNFEHNENPINTIVRFVAWHTGHTAQEVFGAIAMDTASKKALRDKGDIKPFSVKARITNVTGSAGRPSSDIQTAIGRLGTFEDSLRGRGGTDYDGGHLLGYGWYRNWPLINTAMNIAPQDRAENRSIYGYHGGWGSEEEMTRKIAGELPLIVTAYVNYAGGTYTVSLHHIAKHLKAGNVKATIDAMYTARARFVVLNARIPKQYVLEHTVPRIMGVASKLKNKNLAGHLASTFLPTRLPRMALAPIEDAIHRNLLPFWQSQGDRGLWGGAVVSQGQPWYPMDLVNDAMKLAQFGIYYYVYGFNLPLPAAVALVANFFGTGTAASTLQLLPNLGLGAMKWTQWMHHLDGALTTAERSLTVDTAVGYSKSIIAFVSSQTIHFGAAGAGAIGKGAGALKKKLVG